MFDFLYKDAATETIVTIAVARPHAAALVAAQMRIVVTGAVAAIVMTLVIGGIDAMSIVEAAAEAVTVLVIGRDLVTPGTAVTIGVMTVDVIMIATVAETVTAMETETVVSITAAIAIATAAAVVAVKCIGIAATQGLALLIEIVDLAHARLAATVVVIEATTTAVVIGRMAANARGAVVTAKTVSAGVEAMIARTTVLRRGMMLTAKMKKDRIRVGLLAVAVMTMEMETGMTLAWVATMTMTGPVIVTLTRATTMVVLTTREALLMTHRTLSQLTSRSARMGLIAKTSSLLLRMTESKNEQLTPSSEKNPNRAYVSRLSNNLASKMSPSQIKFLKFI